MPHEVLDQVLKSDHDAKAHENLKRLGQSGGLHAARKRDEEQLVLQDIMERERARRIDDVAFDVGTHGDVESVSPHERDEYGMKLLELAMRTGKGMSKKKQTVPQQLTPMAPSHERTAERDELAQEAFRRMREKLGKMDPRYSFEASARTDVGGTAHDTPSSGEA